MHDTPQQTPRESKPGRAAGRYRVPGEFEPVEAVWLRYPADERVWGEWFGQACNEYDYLMSQAARFADVRLIGPAYDWPVRSAWVRDYGPIFAIPQACEGGGGLGAYDFRWGRADEADETNDISRRIAAEAGATRFEQSEKLVGSTIDVNGCGTLLATAGAQRIAGGAGRAAAERVLRKVTGAAQVVWLDGPDDGGGAVSVGRVARFVDQRTIAAVRPPEGHLSYAWASRNWETLKTLRDASGDAMELVPLPAPEPIEAAVGMGASWAGSYASFLTLDEAVLVPVFDQAADELACRRLEMVFGDRLIIPVPARALVSGGGGLFRLSRTQPAV